MTTNADQQSIPTWATAREAFRVFIYRRHLYATIRIALIVGTVLFAINQLDVVLSGKATTTTWIKAGVTYLVPFVVSNLGVLAGTRRHD
ncbi:MAG: nitrate/nitrite transporter NrtS [Ilumatobacteraceae bacterium]